ncbi:MAG: hypothetical protein ACX930_11980 [Erythrobacter sp.]
MSSSLFANRRNALGFAGVILAIAVVGTYSAGAFLPFLEEPEEPQPAVVTEEASAPKVEPRQASTTWSDGSFADDGLADDWGGSSTSPASSPGRSGGSSGDPDEPDFGDYVPDSSPRSARASQGSSGSGSRNSTIRSGAARGAPKLEAPGGGSGGDGGGLTVES